MKTLEQLWYEMLSSHEEFKKHFSNNKKTMLVNLKLQIDDGEMIEFSTETEDIKHINWNEVIYDLYDRHEDMEYADECEDEKEEMKNYDKL